VGNEMWKDEMRRVVCVGSSSMVRLDGRLPVCPSVCLTDSVHLFISLCRRLSPLPIKLDVINLGGPWALVIARGLVPLLAWHQADSASGYIHASAVFPMTETCTSRQGCGS